MKFWEDSVSNKVVQCTLMNSFIFTNYMNFHMKHIDIGIYYYNQKLNCMLNDQEIENI